MTDPTIIAAIIGAGAVIAAALITLLSHRASTKKRYENPSAQAPVPTNDAQRSPSGHSTNHIIGKLKENLGKRVSFRYHSKSRPSSYDVCSGLVLDCGPNTNVLVLDRDGEQLHLPLDDIVIEAITFL